MPASFACSSFAISSMRLAYSITDNTPPFLILSLIVIFLVGLYVVLYVVLMVAVRLLLSYFIDLQFFPAIPLLCAVYSIAFSQALSYALVTSRNAR